MENQKQTRVAAGTWLVALAGASAVICGAFGAHALRATFNAGQLQVWETAVHYHLAHALALALAVTLGRGRWQRVAVLCFALGVVLFSGSLYALALGAPRWCGVITPFGGLSFIAGWLALGVALRARD